jgi:hypothetical protein
MTLRISYRRQEQVIATARVRPQEAETVLVGDHHAGHQVHARGRGEATAAVLQQLAVAQHRVEALLQRGEPVGGGQRQFRRQRIGIQRSVAGGQDLQDHLPAGDGLFVALRLARRVRIALATGARGHHRLRRGLGIGTPRGLGRTCATEGTHQAGIGQPPGQVAGGFLRATPSLRCAFASCAAGLAGCLAAAAGATLARGFGHAAMVQRARAGPVRIG